MRRCAPWTAGGGRRRRPPAWAAAARLARRARAWSWTCTASRPSTPAALGRLLRLRQSAGAARRAGHHRRRRRRGCGACSHFTQLDASSGSPDPGARHGSAVAGTPRLRRCAAARRRRLPLAKTSPRVQSALRRATTGPSTRPIADACSPCTCATAAVGAAAADASPMSPPATRRYFDSGDELVTMLQRVGGRGARCGRRAGRDHSARRSAVDSRCPPRAGVLAMPGTTAPHIFRFGAFRLDVRNATLERDGAPQAAHAEGVQRAAAPGAQRRPAGDEGRVPRRHLARRVRGRRRAEGLRPRDPQALDDDPQTPTYIQTAHRRGYRFVAPVTLAEASSRRAHAHAAGVAAATAAPTAPARRRPGRRSRRRRPTTPAAATSASPIRCSATARSTSCS